ncbi:hypothetical protein GCT62_18105 [Yersinia enterocolitica]|nr:hypothetical protein [Yersinia enterocolitica]
MSELSQSMKQGILCITFLYQQKNLLINQEVLSTINHRESKMKCRNIAAASREPIRVILF